MSVRELKEKLATMDDYEEVVIVGPSPGPRSPRKRVLEVRCLQFNVKGQLGNNDWHATSLISE